MKNVFYFSVLVFILSGCNVLDNNEKKAIELVQESKVQIETDNILGDLFLNFMGIGQNTTWLDFANLIVKDDPNQKYIWKAESTDEVGIYIVSFVDEKNWGHRWEVDIEEKMVKHINQNEYLSRKHGYSRLDRDGKFEVVNITTDTLKLEKKYGYNSKDKSMDVVYIMKGSVINNTDKILTNAEISGELQVIFKDKALKSSNDRDSGFKRKVTQSNPWKPQEEIDFYIKTNNIDEIYLQYVPEYVFFNINLSAEDPIGYNYDKAIEEYNLKEKWEKLNNVN